MQICHGVLFGQTMDDYWLTICFIDDNCLGVNGMDEIFWKSGKGGKGGKSGNLWNQLIDSRLGNFGQNESGMKTVTKVV